MKDDDRKKLMDAINRRLAELDIAQIRLVYYFALGLKLQKEG